MIFRTDSMRHGYRAWLAPLRSPRSPLRSPRAPGRDHGRPRGSAFNWRIRPCLALDRAFHSATMSSGASGDLYPSSRESDCAQSGLCAGGCGAQPGQRSAEYCRQPFAWVAWRVPCLSA